MPFSVTKRISTDHRCDLSAIGCGLSLFVDLPWVDEEFIPPEDTWDSLFAVQLLYTREEAPERIRKARKKS